MKKISKKDNLKTIMNILIGIIIVTASIKLFQDQDIFIKKLRVKCSSIEIELVTQQKNDTPKKTSDRSLTDN